MLVLALEARKWDGYILRDKLSEGSHIPLVVEIDRKFVMGNIVVLERGVSRNTRKLKVVIPLKVVKACMYYASRTMHGLRGRGCNTTCVKPWTSVICNCLLF